MYVCSPNIPLYLYASEYPLKSSPSTARLPSHRAIWSLFQRRPLNQDIVVSILWLVRMVKLRRLSWIAGEKVLPLTVLTQTPKTLICIIFYQIYSKNKRVSASVDCRLWTVDCGDWRRSLIKKSKRPN